MTKEDIKEHVWMFLSLIIFMIAMFIVIDMDREREQQSGYENISVYGDHEGYDCNSRNSCAHSCGCGRRN